MISNAESRDDGPPPTEWIGPIDRLSYNYQQANGDLGNRLQSVTHAAGFTQAGYHDFKQGTSDNTFAYDDAGNMTRDNNKGISIDYKYPPNQPHLLLQKKSMIFAEKSNGFTREDVYRSRSLAVIRDDQAGFCKGQFDRYSVHIVITKGRL